MITLNLVQETFQRVCLYLNIEEIIVCSQVAKIWHQAFKENYVWKALYERDFFHQRNSYVIDEKSDYKVLYQKLYINTGRYFLSTNQGVKLSRLSDRINSGSMIPKEEKVTKSSDSSSKELINNLFCPPTENPSSIRGKLWEVFKRASIGSSNQMLALEKLRNLFHISRLAADIQYSQYSEIFEIENKISQEIEFYLKNDVPTDTLLLLLESYQDVLERLWLLPILSETKLESRDRFKTVNNQWINFDLAKKDWNQNLVITFEAIRSQLVSINGPLTGRIIKKIGSDALPDFIGAQDLVSSGLADLTYLELLKQTVVFPSFLRFILGRIYLESNPWRSAFYFEACLEEIHSTAEKEETVFIKKCVCFQALGYIYHQFKFYKKSISNYEGLLSVYYSCSAACLNLKDQLLQFVKQEEALSNLFEAYYIEKEYPKAVECYEKLKILGCSLDLELDLSTYLKVGDAYYWANQDEKCIDLLKRLIEIAKKDLMNNRQLLFRSYGMLGAIYQRVSNPERAAHYFEKSLDYVSEVEDRRKILSILADLLLTWARDKKDNALWVKGVQHLGALFGLLDAQVDKEEEFNELGRLGDVLLCADKKFEAKQLFEKLVKFSDINSGELAATYNSLGRACLMLEKYEEAVRAFIKAENLFISLENHLGRQACLNNLGLSYFRDGKLALAEETLFKCIDIAKELDKEFTDTDTKIVIFEENAKAYLQLEEVLLSSNKPYQALEISESRRARSLSAVLIKKLSSFKDEVSLSHSLTIQEMQTLAHDLHTTFIVYSLALLDVNKTSISVWVIPPRGEVVFRSFDQDSLAKEVQDPDKLLGTFPYLNLKVRPQKGQKSPSAEFKEQLSRWYEILILPIEQHLPKDPEQTLTIIPEGVLSYFPFAAFQDKHGKYLIEKHPILISPSIKILQLLDQFPRSFPETSLLIGNPITPIPKDNQIPWTEKEVETIAPLFKAASDQILIQQHPTPARLIQQMPQARWIHLACHGISGKITGERPEHKPDPHSVFEGLFKLAADQENPTGFLHSQKIISLTLRTELVFMSACHSGRGRLQREGSIGPVWSFLAAGALSTVASYWPVPDEKTTQMVEMFYSHFLGRSKEGNEISKLNKARALQKAMLMSMEKDRDNIRQWGAFFLSGLDRECMTGGLSSLFSNQQDREGAISEKTPSLKIDPVSQLMEWNKSNIAAKLWKNPTTPISDDMVEKIKHVAIYLEEQGFELKGISADGNCFLNAFLSSYQTLSRKIPLLDEQKDKVSYLRDWISTGYSKNTSAMVERANQIRRSGEWIVAQGEGDLLANALSIPIRVITANQDQNGCGLVDMVTLPGPNTIRQEWKDIANKPAEYILIVDLGGHFIYATTDCKNA